MKRFFSFFIFFHIGLSAFTQDNFVNNREGVDLNLPSGKLWASCNIGADSPEQFGTYYNWTNNPVQEYWDDEWRTPTKEERDELTQNCTYSVDYVNGVKGARYTGSNGNSIFLPFAGYYQQSAGPYGVGIGGQYWTYTPFEDINTHWILAANSPQQYDDNAYYWPLHYFSFPVRPVCDGNNEVDDQYIELIAHPDPEAPSDYYTTFFSSDCNYTLPEGATAYTGEAVGSELVLKETGTNVIPASTAVIIKSDMTPVTLIPTTKNAIVEKGDLLGYDEETSCEPRSVYVLSALNGIMGFYLYKGSTLGAHKAFLPGNAVQANINGLTFIFDETTGVEQIPTKPHTTKTAIYNMNGQRIAPSAKGLHIIKGRKVFIK